MLTKERIIIAANKMFIANGIRNVTTRHIAKRVRISHGNLTYHYPGKEHILEELFRRFKIRAEELTQEKIGTRSEFEVWIQQFFKFQQEFSYFFSDVVEISRKFPDIYFLLRNEVEMIQTHLRNVLYRVFKYNKETVLRFSKDLVLLPLSGFYFNEGKSLKELQKDWFDEVKLYKEPVQIIETSSKEKKKTKKTAPENNEEKGGEAVQISLF